jgi:glyoxylase-like metal-dependent hydrolase (beta-lactamase superfamily II)
MRSVVGSIRHLHRVLVSNVFLLDGGPGDRWLIDTGHWSERATLILELRRARILPSELTGVLLTHRHSDHAGNARFLQKHYGTKIYAHRADAEVLDGSVPRETMRRGEGSFMAGVLLQFENRWPARLRVDRALEQGDEIGSMEVHWVPGHTEGSVFFRHAQSLSLLTGDTLLTRIPPLILRRGLALPYSAFSSDKALAHASIAAFHRAGLPYENLLAGHGPPLVGGARTTFVRFLEEQGVERA